MANGFTLLLGLTLGAWQTWRLRQVSLQLLRRSSQSKWALGTGFARRLLLPTLMLGLVLSWSPLAAVTTLGGYWLGRTVVLIADLHHADSGT